MTFNFAFSAQKMLKYLNCSLNNVRTIPCICSVFWAGCRCQTCLQILDQWPRGTPSLLDGVASVNINYNKILNSILKTASIPQILCKSSYSVYLTYLYFCMWVNLLYMSINFYFLYYICSNIEVKVCTIQTFLT